MPPPEHTPDYPPKTPPPPKRPHSPPRPTTSVAPVPRPLMRISNRRVASWALEAQPWSASRARKHVIGRLHDWGYRSADDTAGDVTELLVKTAVEDGGRRVSLHLADQDRQALVVVVSHQPGLAVAEESALTRVAELGASSCGADTAEDGRRLWAVVDL